MSIRKVSDLETVSLIDGSQDLSDVNDSLLELSFPYHGDGGHSYKSVKAKYEDIRTDLLSSVFSSDTSVVFTTEVTFTSSVNMLCGLNVSGDLCVNIDNPDWPDTTIYVRGGDITFYGYNSVDIKSNRRINLSAPNIYAYTDTMYINGFGGNSSQQIVEFSKANCRLYAPLTSTSAIKIPTTVSSETYSAVNVDYLNSEIASIKQWIQDRDEPDDGDERFNLVETRLYDNSDIVNVEYMLEKKYKLIEDVEDESGSVIGQKQSYFVEYDIKSRPTKIGGDTNNRAIYLPSILDLSSLAMVASETTNMLSPTTSNVQQTKVSLVALGNNKSQGELTGFIAAISASSVAATESLNVHIFAKQASFGERHIDRMLFPWQSDGYYRISDPALATPRYTFSTPAFTTDGHKTFMAVIKGRLGLSGVSNYTNIDLYVAFSPIDVSHDASHIYGDEKVLYSGMPRSATAYPDHERMQPQWKQGQLRDDGTTTTAIIPLEGIEVTVSKKKVVKYISDANNGYYVKSGKSYKERNETTYAYPERYAYMYTCSTRNQSDDYSYNKTIATESNGVLTSGQDSTKGGQFVANKTLSRSSTFFKKLGSEKVYVNGNAFQFVKMFSLSKTYAAKVKSMRIVFSVQNAKTDQFMIVNDDLDIQVLQLD